MTMTDALQDKASALLEIRRYINSGAFRAVLSDLYALEREDREAFVAHVLTNPSAMEKRGASAPTGVFISTSEFNDGRPTLFAVCKYLPDGQRRMTVTFDDVPTGRRQPASR
jgi:hypothetical protein